VSGHFTENGNNVLGIAETKSAVLEDRRAFVGFLRFVDLRASVLHRSIAKCVKDQQANDSLELSVRSLFVPSANDTVICFVQVELD
jgi:hypothetical protein